jgi:hypothetical protein
LSDDEIVRDPCKYGVPNQEPTLIQRHEHSLARKLKGGRATRFGFLAVPPVRLPPRLEIDVVDTKFF